MLDKNEAWSSSKNDCSIKHGICQHIKTAKRKFKKQIPFPIGESLTKHMKAMFQSKKTKGAKVIFNEVLFSLIFEAFIVIMRSIDPVALTLCVLRVQTPIML